MSPHRPVGSRGRVLPLAMFFASFAWAFVYVSLPFHIQRINAGDPATTLWWTGWILGISPLVTVVTAPLWGRLGGRGDPKRYYVLVEALQGLGFFGMALARTPGELFLARMVLGVMGAASTFAFILAGRAAEPDAVRRQVATVQSAMTVGQVTGPLAGALVASWLGFRPSFVVGGLVLLGCAGLVGWGVRVPPVPAAARSAERRLRVPDVARGALIVLGGSTQVFFLASVLPQILPRLGVPPAQTLEVGGVLIFLSGTAAAVGALAAPRLAERLSERALVGGLLVASSSLLALLALAGSVWVYAPLRFLQVLAVAPVFPLVVGRIVQHAGGEAIGFINSARIGAAFLGPVVATSTLAWTSSGVLHLLLALAGMVCVPLAVRRGGAR